MSILFGFLLSVTALFLILLVLVQRGRGGGLAGALGGMGGSSAFGAKAGDVFTRITVITATIWILLCVVAVRVLSTTDAVAVTPALPSGGISAPQDGAAPGTGTEEPGQTTPPPPAAD